MQGQNDEQESHECKEMFIQLQVIDVVHYDISIFIDAVLYDATILCSSFGYIVGSFFYNVNRMVRTYITK